MASKKAIPSCLTDGELRFFKYEDGTNSMSRLDKLVRLQIDPKPYILYWRYKDKMVFKAKELSNEKNYLYLERIYDVRVGKPTDFELGPNEKSYERNFLTVVSGSSITNLKFTHFVYLGKEEKSLHAFSDALFNLVQRTKREEHGLLYHFKKKRVSLF
ncbi:unnamed protein product [Caenorhabditis sp. 36 PRJEB53466]|nr:unnamed protein product [Caenorhabditis sp. 36 PRJEB53466]